MDRIKSIFNVNKIMNKIYAYIEGENINLNDWKSEEIALITQTLGCSNKSVVKENAIRNIIVYLIQEETNISEWSIYELMLVFNTVFRINSREVESVLSKIADTIVSRKTELNNLSTDDLATIAAGLTMHRSTRNHNAVQKIANYVSNTT